VSFLTEQVLADARGTVVGFVELTSFTDEGHHFLAIDGFRCGRAVARPATQAEIDEWDVVVRVLDPRERHPGDVVEVVYTP
jgi:hypothetical protein